MVEDVLNIFTKDTLSNFKKDDELYFLWKIQKGWGKKNIPTTKEYIDRINYEVNVICKMGFVDYMLMIADILEFADKNGIPRGPGRGCFSPNNRVRVNVDEFKNINNVIPFKDKVQCEDGEWRQVEKVWEYDCNEELLTIQTESGKMLDGITEDHKVKVVTKEDYEKGNLEPKWIESEKIKEGDFLIEQGVLNAKLTKVTNITKKYYQGKVYDLKVKDVHSYTVDDLTVHNSAAGSIVSYALNITTIDPIIYGLYFERFLNPSRISNPDVDIDLGTLRRHEAFEYLQERYGEDRVASIMTKGLMKSRSIIRNVGGSLGMPTGPGSEIDKIAKLFPNMEGDFEESVAESEELQKYAVKYPELFDKAKRLAGKPKSVGVHAAGTLVAPCKIEELMPMGRGTNGKTSVVQWDMYDVEDAGLVKLDLLGLNTLDVIDRTIKLIEKRHGKKIDIEAIPKDDKLTINVFRKGKTNGLFQLERKYVQKICERMDITKFEDICAINALIRPGTLHSGATETYIRRKTGEEEYICPHESLKDCLKDTYGILLYQETIMKCVVDYAGFSLAESDNLRRCVADNNYFVTKYGTFTVREVFNKFNSGSDIKVLCPQNGKHVYKSISNIWSNGVKDIIRIKVGSGHFIECTKDHPVFTNNGWKNAGDVTKDDYLAVFSKYYQKGFGKISHDMAMVCGYFVSEGCYTDKCSPKITNADKEIISFIKETIRSNFGEDSFRENEFDNGVFDIVFKGKARKWFESVFKRAVSKDKEIPTCIKNESKESVACFLAAYFDGDGTVSESNASYCTASDNIARFIQISLMRFGISACICDNDVLYRGEMRKYYDVHICSNKGLSLFYSNIGKYCIKKDNVEKIRQILACGIKFENEKFLFPNNIMRPVLEINNVNDILDGFIRASGSMYKKNMTYSRVAFINKYIGDEMINHVLNSDYKYSKVSSIENVGQREVFDFTIDSDEHSAYVNGILVHNCIGKKKVEQVEAMKSEFFDRARKLGRPDEVTQELWNQIDAAKNYSFNASHSCGYGKITYQSAWLKSHYFLEFMTELLNGEENSGEPKLDSYLRECRTNGVDILPPDARVANNYFQIEGKKGIRFGLGFVKGVTSLATNALRECSGHMDTFTDILMNDKGYLKKNIMENLILVGAFDYMGGNRAEILNRYSVVKDMVEKYKSQQKRKGEGVNIRKEYTREDILEVEKNTKFFDKKYSMEEYIAFEHQLCKCYIVNDPLTPFEDLIYSDEYRDIMDIVDKRFDRTKPVKLIAVVRSMNVHTISKGSSEGREMCFFDVFDTFMEITCIAFPEVFEKIKEKMFENSVYTFIGKYDGESIILNDAELMLKV